MEAKQFLDVVMPDKGNKVIALAYPKTKGKGVWFKYKTYKTTNEVTVGAELFDEKAETVYFAVNSFGDWYFDEEKKKNRLRTQVNVVACRSLYDDLDVEDDKPAKYATREEALSDIIKLAQAIKLTPTITSSGGGYHCYFSLDEDVSQEVWRELSSLKRDITTHLRIKADRSVDMDSARILRPVGTRNRKTGTPVPVEVVKLGKQYPVVTVRSKLQDFIKENGVQPAPTEPINGVVPNAFAGALGDHPPSDADKVAEHCAAIRKFRDTKGDIPEPHWHRAIGVVKHCTDGERIIHEWSQGYSGYSEGETQAKIVNQRAKLTRVLG